MALSYVVVDTPMGPFTVGASESAVHEAFFGKPAARVSVGTPGEQSILAMVSKLSTSLSFHVQPKDYQCFFRLLSLHLLLLLVKFYKISTIV